MPPLPVVPSISLAFRPSSFLLLLTGMSVGNHSAILKYSKSGSVMSLAPPGSTLDQWGWEPWINNMLFCPLGRVLWDAFLQDPSGCPQGEWAPVAYNSSSPPPYIGFHTFPVSFSPCPHSCSLASLPQTSPLYPSWCLWFCFKGGGRGTLAKTELMWIIFTF